jgi:hypothetical protein
MNARRIVGYLLLCLALLITQQAVAVHALTHPTGSAPSKQDPASAPHGGVCALCIAATHSGSALVSAPLLLQASSPAALLVVPVAWTFHPTLTLAFSSRAPPALL